MVDKRGQAKLGSSLLNSEVRTKLSAMVGSLSVKLHNRFDYVPSEGGRFNPKNDYMLYGTPLDRIPCMFMLKT